VVGDAVWGEGNCGPGRK